MNEKDYEEWISFFNLIQMIFGAICVIGMFTSAAVFWVGALVCLFALAFNILFNLINRKKFDKKFDWVELLFGIVLLVALLFY